jgi:hypothetical protein
MARRFKLDPNKMPLYELPPPQRNVCHISGKQIFVNELSAVTEAKRAREERGRALDVYYCLHCNGWHFTSRKS